MSQLDSWMEMLRALQINQKAKEGKSIDKEYQEAKLHMQFLSDQGCALPVSPVIEVNVNGPVKENGMIAKKTEIKLADMWLSFTETQDRFSSCACQLTCKI